MNKIKTTQITVADPDFLERLDSRLERIEARLTNLNILPQEEMLTRDQFMKKVNIGKTKFFLLLASGLLETTKIGRKIYVPKTQVDKYFSGGMNLGK